MRPIRTAAVLGAGTMGAQIAAHLANAGVATVLLDLSSQAAADGLRRARGLRPDPFFTPETHALIRAGGFDELDELRACDWIVEAVVERLEVKQALLARVEPFVQEGAIVSSNTSGIPLAAIAEGRGESFRRRWLGTHFFNPPRYLPLVEIIPTAETEPAALARITEFSDRRLGKGVVIARDAPGFIANRIGVYGLLQALRLLESGAHTIEEIDAVTGPAIGRPKSATFRTLDLVGLDVLADVTEGLHQRLHEREGDAFAVPAIVGDLVRRGYAGTKAGRGFYWKAADGDIHVLEPAAFSYRPVRRPSFASIEAAKAIDNVGGRIQALFRSPDAAGRIVRAVLAPVIAYAARVAPEIAYSTDDVDRAVRWGFGWEMGPFEMLRSIGVDEVVQALDPDARDEAGLVLQSAADGWGEPRPPVDRQSKGLLNAAKPHGVIRRNPGASLVDLGGGVLCVEFHTRMNALGGDAIQLLHDAVREAASGFAALVVANDAPNFSAGANLMLLLLEAQEGNWDELDLAVRSFQQAAIGLRHAEVPVVVCPTGLTLGGGCEIALHADHVQAAAETYMGLVETGVGLIPGGAGTKEMLARAMEGLPPGADTVPFVRRVFETIGLAALSTSAADARRLGYLRPSDGITMHRDRLIADARAVALALASFYVPPARRTAIPVGGPTMFAALKLGVHLAWRAGRLSEHDALVGRKLAWVLSGGSIPAAGTLTEQELLDLEREAFLSLCGERKTQERIAYTLKTGKTLRN